MKWMNRYNVVVMKNTYLLADIGNTSYDLAKYDGSIISTKKIFLSKKEELERYISSIKDEIGFAMISSVNHNGLLDLVECLKKQEIPYEKISPYVMDDFCAEHGYKVDNTSYLGTDLFCDIIAVDDLPAIIIDLGTVGKILFIDENKVFHGASIFPDIEQFAKMMDMSTDLLEESALRENPPLVSLKTGECISSGAINGMSALVDGMVNRIMKEYPQSKPYHIYLTGGCSPMIEKTLKEHHLSSFIKAPNLCLYGIAKILEDRKK
jgi:type III pantothenate kinase